MRSGLLLTIVTAVAAASAAAQEPADTSILGQDGLYNRPFIGALGGTSIGGYLEGNSNYEVEDGITEGFSMELRRFNVFLFSQVSRRVRFISELEFEHGTEEIALETALVDLQLNPAFTVRAGILLPPVGYFNQNHDSPRWDFIDRPLVSTEIVPATLSEIGVGVYGRLFPAGWTLTYDLYLTNGVQDGVVENEKGRTHIASGKAVGQFEEDNNGSPAWSGWVALDRAGWGEAGVSFYTAIYNSFRLEGEVVDDERRTSLLALDLGTAAGPLNIRSELALALVDVPPSLTELYAERQWGGHVDLLMRVLERPILGYEDAFLSVVLRAERVDFNVGHFSSTGEKIYDEGWSLVPGVSLRPTPDTVFRLNYRRGRHRDLVGNAASKSSAWQIGFATYF